MKKTLKIFGYIFLSLFLLTIILVVTASLSQKKIVGIVLNTISESVQVPIEIEDLSFTLIKRFPYATFEFSGVRIGAEEHSDSVSHYQNNEDILNIKHVFVSVKSIPLIKGIYEIVKVEIDGASLNYKVDSLGFSNIDFIKELTKNTPESDTIAASTLPVLNLKKIKLKNTAIFFADDTAQIAADLFFPSLEIAGKIADEKFDGTIEGDLKLANCNFKNTSLKRMEEATFDFKLDYNMDTLQIKSLEANTDGAQFEITGKAAFKSDIFTDLNLESTDLDLGKLLKYVPEELLNEYGVEDLNGIMQLDGTLKGIIADSIMPRIDLAISLKNGFAKTKDYPTVKNIFFSGEISNGNEQNNKTSSAIFKSFYAETDSSSADLSFSFSNLDKPIYTLNSKLKIDIEEFRNFIPDTLIQNISGVIIAEISTKGQVPDSIDDNFINSVAKNSSAKLDFTNFNIEMDSMVVNDFSGSVNYFPGQLEVNNLNVLIPDYKLKLKNSSFNAEIKGPITQTQNLDIDLKSFYFETPQGNIQGSAKIKNPEHPDFIVDANALINLAELKPFIPDSLIGNISGILTAEISTQGKLNLDSISEQINDIIFKQSKFSLVAKNISATMPDTLQKLTDLNGEVKIDKNRILISNMKGVAADIDFLIDSVKILNIYNAITNKQQDTISISKISGIAAGMDFSIDTAKIVNVYNAVIKNQKETVFASGNFNFGALDYSMLVPLFNADSTKNLNTENSDLSETESVEDRNFLFEFKGKIAAKSFKYEKVLLENISAKFKVSDSIYIVDQFKINAFEGSSNSSVRISTLPNGEQIVNVKNLVNQMDIKKFLYAFDNFGQDSMITYENISGLFSTDLHSRFVFVADTLVSKDIRIMGDIILENGRIINYQPAMDVASFTGIKELDNIELKTVNSSIFLFKNKLYVPTTYVVSTSMDFSAFGMQSFGDDYEYHLQMKLGAVLTGKSKKLLESQKKSGDDISEDDIDKNTVKVIYANIDGKQKTGFDNKKLQKSMELKIQVQQKMLELIFHPKLISFDTGVK